MLTVPPALVDLAAGHVQVMFPDTGSAMAMIQAGKIRPIAVPTAKRHPLLPDVPTSYEQGLPQFDIAPFYAVFVPTGTPQAIVDKHRDLAA